jgi:hypothetical protein
MESTSYHEIRDHLRQLYVDVPAPRLVSFSGSADSTIVASLVFDAFFRSRPTNARIRPAATHFTASEPRHAEAGSTRL